MKPQWIMQVSIMNSMIITMWIMPDVDHGPMWIMVMSIMDHMIIRPGTGGRS